MKKQILPLLLGLTLIGCAGVSKQDNTSAETFTVLEQSVTIPTRFSATLRAEGDADIVSPVRGKVVEQRVEIGSKVNNGDTLFIIEDAGSSAALNQAMANLKAAEEQERRVTSEYEIIKNLYAHDQVGEEMLNQAGEEYRMAKTATTQAKAAVWKADAERTKQIIYSPETGEIGNISTKVGEVVDANTVLATITEKSKMMLMRGCTDNEIHCTVEIPMQYDNVLLVPLNGIADIEGTPHVYKIGADGKPIATAVEIIKVADGQRVIVLSGLQAGDVIQLN